MPQGIAIGSGIIPFGSDFTGIFDGHGQANSGVIATGGENLEGGVGLIAVNEGSYASTFDETGGILALTTDTGNDDNNCLVAGVFSPRDGKMVVKARFKYSNVDCAIFVGFSETLSIATPVMPAEFATATMTYNGTGGIVGLQYDVDGTTDDFRACMGDAGAAISDSSNGIRANATLTADRWFEAEVILNEDGSAECWLGDSSNANALNMNKLALVKRFSAGTLLTTTDVFYACLILENRTANARVLETDYFAGTAGRDWRF